VAGVLSKIAKHRYWKISDISGKNTAGHATGGDYDYCGEHGGSEIYFERGFPATINLASIAALRAFVSAGFT
jgi:hypothetical protein